MLGQLLIVTTSTISCINVIVTQRRARGEHDYPLTSTINTTHTRLYHGHMNGLVVTRVYQSLERLVISYAVYPSHTVGNYSILLTVSAQAALPRVNQLQTTSVKIPALNSIRSVHG